MTRLHAVLPLCLAMLAWFGSAQANVFTLVEVGGPDLAAPQPAAAVSGLPLSVVFTDATGDFDPPINLDLVRVELAFDPTTGDYQLV